ncbi:MAG: putative Intracellular septation protein, partial [Pseudomonadota bacterium]
GAANLFVAYRFSEQVWVNFKLFGLMGLTLAFIVAQGFFLSRYLQPEEAVKES